MVLTKYLRKFLVRELGKYGVEKAQVRRMLKGRKFNENITDALEELFELATSVCDFKNKIVFQYCLFFIKTDLVTFEVYDEDGHIVAVDDLLEFMTKYRMIHEGLMYYRLNHPEFAFEINEKLEVLVILGREMHIPIEEWRCDYNKEMPPMYEFLWSTCDRFESLGAQTNFIFKKFVAKFTLYNCVIQWGDQYATFDNQREIVNFVEQNT